jgi:hypothetical protein
VEIAQVDESMVVEGLVTIAEQRNHRCVMGLVTPVHVAGVTEIDFPTTGTALADAFMRVPPLFVGLPVVAG